MGVVQASDIHRSQGLHQCQGHFWPDSAFRRVASFLGSLWWQASYKSFSTLSFQVQIQCNQSERLTELLKQNPGISSGWVWIGLTGGVPIPDGDRVH